LAARRGLVAVPLHRADRAEGAGRREGLRQRLVDEQRDRLDERRQRPEDARGGGGGNVARRARVEVQAEGVRPQRRGQAGVGFAGDAADFDAQRAHRKPSAVQVIPLLYRKPTGCNPWAWGCGLAHPSRRIYNFHIFLKGLKTMKAQKADLAQRLQKVEDEFVELWNNMGSLWGISPTMARIHGLLYIS